MFKFVTQDLKTVSLAPDTDARLTVVRKEIFLSCGKCGPVVGKRRHEIDFRVISRKTSPL